MLFRALLALCLIASVGAIAKVICQNYCASINGGPGFENCSPWVSFATQTNKTCFNLCVKNCFNVYDGSCIDNDDFRCCLKLTPTKKSEYKQSGCNYLYEALV